MTTQECYGTNCVYLSDIGNARNRGVTHCSSYYNIFKKCWWKRKEFGLEVEYNTPRPPIPVVAPCSRQSTLPVSTN